MIYFPQKVTNRPKFFWKYQPREIQAPLTLRQNLKEGKKNTLSIRADNGVDFCHWHSETKLTFEQYYQFSQSGRLTGIVLFLFIGFPSDVQNRKIINDNYSSKFKFCCPANEKQQEKNPVL